uniref:ABC transporter domain-containing protein n=2 Tax=Phytophthora ramorum TaxID=164328 RepID=H3GF97_PHYRM
MASPRNHFIRVNDTPKTRNVASEPLKFTLQWRNLSLKAEVKNPATKKTEEKVILNDVSGSAQPGELLVIMGPSGAGKSSLLDCISGRNGAVEGDILLNGQPWTKATKRMASYVMQDDLFYETLTVKEHLIFQARLRMGKTSTEQQYMHRVDEVMEELGLMKCRDTLIGGESLRGISGGERKRLSFATEILTNPSILFADEPTSGLDSFMAETVIKQLQQIARDGRTVLATIHQPSSEVFAIFDQLYLLSDGSPVYQGKASESVDYFASLGYPCPPQINPSDYFMRQLVVIDKATDEAGVARVESLKGEWRKHQTLSRSESVSLQEGGGSQLESTRLHLLGQISVLAQRNTLRFLRDGFAVRVPFIQNLFLAVIVGLIYLQLDLDQKGIQNYTGAFFFLVTNQIVVTANPVFVSVPMELALISREYKGGLYHLMSWYLSKNISELPMQIILPIVFFVPIYFLMGIGHGFEVFIYLQLVMILINSTAIGLAYMVSCLCPRVDIAPLIGMVLIMPFMLFGGLLINSDDCPDYFVWIQYISPVKYGYEAMMKIFWNAVPSIACSTANCTARTGAEVLESYSMTSRSALGDSLLLLLLNIVFRVIAFVAIWFQLRQKK